MDPAWYTKTPVRSYRVKTLCLLSTCSATALTAAALPCNQGEHCSLSAVYSKEARW